MTADTDSKGDYAHGTLRQLSGPRFVSSTAESLGAPLNFDRAKDDNVGHIDRTTVSYVGCAHEDLEPTIVMEMGGPDISTDTEFVRASARVCVD